MVSGAFTNNGFIIIADTELNDRFNYKASDAVAAAKRPRLVIQYSVPQGKAPSGYLASYRLPQESNSQRLESAQPLEESNTADNSPLVAPFSSATFVYDGDGRRVKSIFNPSTGSGQAPVTTYFVGAHYEVTGSTITKYYYAGSQRIAIRTNGTLNYLLGDHLGSTSLTTDASGQVVSELRYKAWGEVRYASGNTATQYTFTGQFSYVNDFGLMFYNARWLDVSLGRFAQADSVIPGPSNSQAWDRYAYSFNNPLVYVDPSGHDPILGFIAGFLKEFARTNLWFHPGAQKDLAIQNNESDAELAGRLVADVASMTIGVIEAGGGTGVAGGGVVACATGVGCLAGAGTIAAGGVLIAQGAGTTLTAADGLGTTLAAFSARNQGSSSSDDYPRVIDPRTKRPIPRPPSNLKRVPEDQRVSWGAQERADFIREWYDRGYSTPQGGWSNYDIHHIIPREYGGSNDFWNLVPVKREVHQKLLNPWWSRYEMR